MTALMISLILIARLIIPISLCFLKLKSKHLDEMQMFFFLIKKYLLRLIVSFILKYLSK